MNHDKPANSVLVNQEIWIEIMPQQTTIRAFLALVDYSTSGIAVAVNNEIITSEQWIKHSLNDNDKISIFGAIAGG